ncbi:hypothetical protein, partial [Crocosphaera sp.]|uniref:hypothetical protein n=1 Tax=Crocosphaera sp. TaxID=2729996 RepID=UPI002606B90C
MNDPIDELREIAQKYQLQEPEFQYQWKEGKWQCTCVIIFEETIITKTKLGQKKNEARRKAVNSVLPIIRKLVTIEEVNQSDSLQSRIKQWFKDFRRDWNQKSNIENAEAIVNIFVGFIALITAINAASVYIDSQSRQDEIATRRDLSTYKDYGEYLTTYHEIIQPNISQFLNDFEINYIRIPGTEHSPQKIIRLGNINGEKEAIKIKESEKNKSTELKISEVKKLSIEEQINIINSQLKKECQDTKEQKKFCFKIIHNSLSSSIELKYYNNIENEIDEKQMAKIVTIHFVNDEEQCQKLQKPIQTPIQTQETQCFLLYKEADNCFYDEQTGGYRNNEQRIKMMRKMINKPKNKEGLYQYESCKIPKSKEVKTEIDRIEKTQKRYTNACKALLPYTKTRTGIEVFYSDIFQDYRAIHLFYESLGLGIKNDLIQFDTIFSLFTYPALWEDDKVTVWASFDPFFELENCLRNNWFEEDKPLLDFSSHFIQLGANYHYARVFNKYKELNCRRWWQFWRFFILHEGDTNKCRNLREKIHLIEHFALNKGSSFELYNDPSISFKTKKLLSFMKKNSAEIIILFSV